MKFSIGDQVTACLYSDSHAYEVRRVTPCTLTLRRLKARLLNGANIGAPDALHFSPGGFCGHTSGVQRYEYTRDERGPLVRAHWSAKRGYFRLGGSRIVPGASEHYDFNF